MQINAQVQLTCRIYAAWAHLFINAAEKRWLMFMENVPQNEKLTLLSIIMSSN
jgi:hypothetical protein